MAGISYQRVAPSGPQRSAPRATIGLLVFVALLAMSVVTASRASAAAPVISGPDRVFTMKNTALAFTGNELLANNKDKTISIAATSDDTTCKTGSMPPVYTECASMHLQVNHGLLKLTLQPGMSTSGDPTGSADLQFAGTVTQINDALKTLVFTPDNDYVNDKSSSDGTPPAILTANAIDGTTGESTSSNNLTDYIEIRVDTINAFPTEDHPGSDINVVASSTTELDNQFLVKDDDVNRDSNEGKMLLIGWVDCGTFDLSVSTGFTAAADIKQAMVDAGVDSTVADAIYAFLPDSAKNHMFITSTQGVSAVAGVGTLDDLNGALDQFTFHAPANADSCTFTQIVDDLGFRGLPGQYENTTHVPNAFPTGIELPAMGFAIPQVTFVVDGGTVPSVTIEQAAGQADPTGTAPIHFTATFSDDVSGFGDAGDVTLSGTAGATTAVISQPDPTDAKVYDVAVSGMTQSGLVTATIPANKALAVVDPHNGNSASTSGDGTVEYQTTPSVVVSLHAGQAASTSTSPIVFDVMFSEAVTGFTNADITLGGTAGASAAVVGGSGPTYTVTVTGMSTNGTVDVSVPASAASAVASLHLASTASNTGQVTWVQPLPTQPTVVVSLHAGQAASTSTSPIVFDVTFSEAVTGFTNADITLGGTAGASAAVVGGSGPTYTVTVTGMSTNGTVDVSVPASAATAAAPPNGANTASNVGEVQWVQPGVTNPTVVVSLHAGQADPTSTSPIQFDVTFSEAVTGFIASDVTLTGTAGATTAVVSGSGADYVVAVSGMTSSGTVGVSVGPNVANATAPPNGSNLSSNLASVTYVKPTPPTVTINQAAGQADPTSTSPIHFTATFSEAVDGFTASDITLTGTSGANTIIVTGTGPVFDVAVTGMSATGDVIVAIPAGAATASAAPNLSSAASSSIDNSVHFILADGSSPLTITVPPDKTVPNDPGQAGAIVTFAAATSTGGTAPVTIVCNAASGSFFALGATLVTCTATDSAAATADARAQGAGDQAAAATASGSFTITVDDTEAPTISHPDVTVHTTDPNGVGVNYAAPTAADNSGVAPTVVCAPASGAHFPIGTTLVTCTATDAASNVATASFHVLVILDETTTTTTTTTPSGVTTTTSSSGVLGNGSNNGLPRTGGDTWGSIMVALGLCLMGVALVLAGRRRLST